MSERLAFKFYKSYYQVYNELNDKDKLSFINALLKKQFEGIEPNLSGMVKFAYLSQEHSINKQVKGWEDKTGCKLNSYDTTQGGCIDPTQGGCIDPKVQEKEEEEEKEEVNIVFTFDEFWSKYPNKTGKKPCEKKFNSLSKSDKQKIKDTIDNFASYKPFKDYTHPNPATYLNQARWDDEISTNINIKELSILMSRWDNIEDSEKRRAYSMCMQIPYSELNDRHKTLLTKKEYAPNS